MTAPTDPRLPLADGESPAAENSRRVARGIPTERHPSAPPPSAPPPAQQMSLFAVGTDGGPAGDAGAAAAPGPVRLARPTMWQLHGRYLLAETRGGVVVVDQRAAYERILYEAALDSFGSRGMGAQRLLFPMTLELPPGEHALAVELATLLAGIGFEIQPLDGGSVVVTGVPNPHPYFDAERCIRRMIGELTAGSPLLDTARSQHQRIALSFATHAALQPGQRLSQQEMGELFDRLFATGDPYRDLLGRSTLVQISLGELEEWLSR